MIRTKEQFKSDIIAQLQQQSLNLLVDALAEAQAKLAELEAAKDASKQD